MVSRIHPFRGPRYRPTHWLKAITESTAAKRSLSLFARSLRMIPSFPLHLLGAIRRAAIGARFDYHRKRPGQKFMISGQSRRRRAVRAAATQGWFLAVCVIAPACSGGPIAPFVGTPGALDGPLSLLGRVVVNQSQTPLAGATLEAAQGGSGKFTSDENGQFALTGLATGLLQLTLSAPGYVTHRTKVNLTSSRTGFVLDLIASAPPFDLQFYREFARGTFDGPIQATRRWTMNPSFYIHTTTSDTGAQMSPSVLADIERVFVNAVPELSGGLYRVATVEKGAEPRGTVSGWVEVLFYYGEIPGSVGLGGDSTIGGDSGRIRIRSNPELELLPQRGCPSFPVRMADHEIVHAMGFWHSTDNYNDFYSGPACSGAGRPARVPFHAAVLYSRPRGNTDIDDDPGNFAYPLAQQSSTVLRVSCALQSFLKK
jgi:hypothetical protein